MIALCHVGEELGRIPEHQKLHLRMVTLYVMKKLFLLTKHATYILVQVIISFQTFFLFNVFRKKIKWLSYTLCVDVFFHSVHCEWDDWIIGECSRTCAGGWRIKTRTAKIVAEHGGEECTGSSSVEESCNLQNCPSMKNYSNLF